MNSVLRKRFHEKTYKIMLWLTLLSLAGFYSLPSLIKRARGEEDSVALVNGLAISYPEFRRKVLQEENRIQYFRQQLGNQADELLKSLGMANPQETALNELIQEKILESIATSIKIAISPEYIVRKLQDPLFILQEVGPVPGILQNDGTLHMATLNRYLRNQGLTPRAFEELLEQKLQQQIVLDFLQAAVYVPQFMIQQRFVRDTMGKKFNILTFSLDAYMSKDDILDTTLQAYFERNSKKYQVPEKRTAYAWEFLPQDYGITVEAKEIETYYTRHKKDRYQESPAQLEVRRMIFKIHPEQGETAARERALKALQEVKKNPQTFEQVAQTHADDATQAKYQLIPLQDNDSAVVRAALGLKKEGDISSIVTTQEGLEIIQRGTKKEARYTPLDSVQEQIRMYLQGEKFKRAFAHDMHQLLATPELESDTISQFVAQKRGHGAVYADIEKTAIATNPIAAKLFKLEKDGYTFIAQADKGLLLHFVDSKPAHIPQLSTIKEQVKKDYCTAQAYEKMRIALEEAYNKIPAQTLSELTKHFPAHYSETSVVFSTDQEQIQKLIKQELPVSAMLALTTSGSTIKELTPTKAYIIQLARLEDNPQISFETQRDAIKKQLYEELQRNTQQGAVASLYRNGTIKIHRLNTV